MESNGTDKYMVSKCRDIGDILRHFLLKKCDDFDIFNSYKLGGETYEKENENKKFHNIFSSDCVSF